MSIHRPYIVHSTNRTNQHDVGLAYKKRVLTEDVLQKNIVSLSLALKTSENHYSTLKYLYLNITKDAMPSTYCVPYV